MKAASQPHWGQGGPELGAGFVTPGPAQLTSCASLLEKELQDKDVHIGQHLPGHNHHDNHPHGGHTHNVDYVGHVTVEELTGSVGKGGPSGSNSREGVPATTVNQQEPMVQCPSDDEDEQEEGQRQRVHRDKPLAATAHGAPGMQGPAAYQGMAMEMSGGHTGMELAVADPHHGDPSQPQQHQEIQIVRQLTAGAQLEAAGLVPLRKHHQHQQAMAAGPTESMLAGFTLAKGASQQVSATAIVLHHAAQPWQQQQQQQAGAAAGGGGAVGGNGPAAPANNAIVLAQPQAGPALADNGSGSGSGSISNSNGSSSEWEIDASRIQLGKRLAVGGFAEVFIGKYEGTLVAVKKLFAADAGAWVGWQGVRRQIGSEHGFEATVNTHAPVCI